MPRHTTVKHPKDQLHAVARAWFLEVIRTDCPEVLDDLWKNVFVPFRKFLSPTSVGTPLKPRGSQAEDVIRGSQHRRVFAAIFRWARRWNLNAPWICNQARRTLLFWAKYPRLVKSIPVRSTDPAASPGPVGGQVWEWGPVIITGSRPGRPYRRRGAATKGRRALRVVRSKPCVRPAHAAQGTRRRGGRHESSRRHRYGTHRVESSCSNARSPRPAPRPTPEEAQPAPPIDESVTMVIVAIAKAHCISR